MFDRILNQSLSDCKCSFNSLTTFLRLIPRLSISLVFQAELYEILICVHEIETAYRPHKYANICSNSQAALKAFQAAKTTSPLIRQCQKALNDISTRHTVWLYQVPGHAELR
jgi:hypothetical protein